MLLLLLGDYKSVFSLSPKSEPTIDIRHHYLNRVRTAVSVPFCDRRAFEINLRIAFTTVYFIVLQGSIIFEIQEKYIGICSVNISGCWHLMNAVFIVFVYRFRRTERGNELDDGKECLRVNSNLTARGGGAGGVNLRREEEWMN